VAAVVGAAAGLLLASGVAAREGFDDPGRDAPVPSRVAQGGRNAPGSSPVDARGRWAEPCELSPATDRARTPSQRCLSCHDGSTGAGTFFEMGRGRPLGMSHPVEVDYGAIAGRKADRYVAPSLLPSDVPLVDGKVACTTCHDGASRLEKRTVDPARLCSSCHQM